MVLMEPSKYGLVFERWRGASAHWHGDEGNVGDHLIRLGTKALFDFYEIRFSGRGETPDVVFWGGGGNMGSLYPQVQTYRRRIATYAKQRRVPFVILPQTWAGPDDVKGEYVYAREFCSIQKFCPEATLAPDLALAYNAPAFGPPANDIGVFFRSDREKTVSALRTPNARDPVELASTPTEYLELASRYRVIYTDRLHFAIAALMCRRETHLWPNSYHKNLGVFEAWLKPLGCHWGTDAGLP